MQSLTSFRQEASAHLDRLAKSGDAEVLTVNGRARGVVMSPEACDTLLDKAEIGESLATLDAALAEVKAGLGSSPQESLRRVRQKLGLPTDGASARSAGGGGA